MINENDIYIYLCNDIYTIYNICSKSNRLLNTYMCAYIYIYLLYRLYYI